MISLLTDYVFVSVLTKSYRLRFTTLYLGVVPIISHHCLIGFVGVLLEQCRISHSLPVIAAVASVGGADNPTQLNVSNEVRGWNLTITVEVHYFAQTL